MKWMSFKHEGKEKYGFYLAEKQAVAAVSDIDGAPTTLASAIEEGQFLASVCHNPESVSFVEEASIEWLAPIPRPLKNVMCVGKNYRDHAIEMGGEASVPEHPMIFTKASTAVSAHGAPIPAYESLTDSLDYEGELAVIIGRKGKEISREEAFDYVFGYTVLNDITARDLQSRHKQFFIGKSLDGSCPIGPWIVSKDEIADPHNLAIQTMVNGEIRQQSNTSHFIFPIDEVIHVLSKGMTLEPGDIIATGTPAGVGFAMEPKGTLQKGDTVEITVEGIGTLSNTVQE
ncbi:fumarylacetoacetate hydrolase family protein [Domibacillus sp. PGB-M46]|uniref:fumarylacetoacetate hydrolase family protein n=1 Tax=Domibacillus sp. PGB-M46 TaxID=2910255 RepID=UPI001F561A92|nr:fumarylacetoacetate hydrolase family protein [Domibacillus sp. PGB-M46]MCI2253476.1 fumarylacetoacetate hydrolase family protein [Domibacillus sp. PGB-M46]